MEIKIYPNPAKEFLYIENGEAQSIKIEMYNKPEAKIYASTILPQSTLLLPVHFHKKGLYLFRLTTQKGYSKTIKVMVG